MSASEGLRIAVLLACLASFGCVEHALIESARPTEFVEREPGVPPAPNEGSVWRGTTASGSFLYFDRKARGYGDLVTVVLTESLRAEGSANTSLDRQSAISSIVSSEVGLTDFLVEGFEKFLDFFGITNTAAQTLGGEDLAVIESQSTKRYQGDGETNRESSFNGVVTCRVVAELPGDLFRVYGRRKILVNHELQLVTLEGLVRRRDIQIDNTVASTQLADVKLTFDGVGVIDDEQRPPMFGRIFSWIYPF